MVEFFGELFMAGVFFVGVLFGLMIAAIMRANDK